MVIAMMGPTSSRAPASAAASGRHALAQVSLDILDHDNGIVDNEADRKHDGQQGQQVDVKPKSCISATAPISETGMATIGTRTERMEPRKRKMTSTTISKVSPKRVLPPRARHS
jgi:hypothetical protein